MPTEETQLADSELASRKPAIAVALMGMVGVISAGAAIGVPSVEKHLRTDIERSVLTEVASVRVVVDGRTVSLVGPVRSADDRRELGDRVRRRWGVERVNLDRLRVDPNVAGSSPPAGQARKASQTRNATTTKNSVPTAGPRSVGSSTATSTGSTSTPSTSTLSTASPSTSIATSIIRAADPASITALQTQLTAIRRTTPIVFVRSNPTISLSAGPALDNLAALISGAALVVRIEAHTDGSGDPQRNLALSEVRANAVRDALIGRGVAPALLVAVGRGEAAPIANNETARGREINRRIEFVVDTPSA